MAKFDVQTCRVCGDIEFEDKMLEYNDHFFCGIRCKKHQERIDDAKLNGTYTPVICGDN